MACASSKHFLKWNSESWEEIILPLSNPSVAHDGIDVINVNPGFINPYSDY